jgi:hypothetical protein
VQAVLRGNPHRAIAGGEHAPRATGPETVHPQHSPVGAHLVEPGVAAHPHRAVGGLREAADAPGTQRTGAPRLGMHRAHQAHSCVQDGQSALLRAQPDLAGAQLQYAAYVGFFKHAAVADTVAQHVDAAVGGIMALQATAVAARPDPATAVAQQGAHLVGGQAGRLPGHVAQVAQHRDLTGIAHFDAVGAGHPDLARWALDDVIDGRSAANGVGGSVPRLPRGGIEHQKLALLRAYPQPSVVALDDPSDRAASQRRAVCVAWRRLEGGMACATPHQPVPGTDPQRALAVNGE